MSAQDDETTPDKEKINIINTNARSLLPKLNSLVDLIQENDTKIAFVTETWMQDGQVLDKLGRTCHWDRGSTLSDEEGGSRRPMEYTTGGHIVKILPGCWATGMEQNMYTFEFKVSSYGG